MRPSQKVRCETPGCVSMNWKAHAIPDVEIDPATIRIIMISECTPASLSEHFYSPGQPLFATTTIQAFRDAGQQVQSIGDILGLGVYLTTAVKCGKTGSLVSKEAVWTCSHLLEREIRLFPNVSALLLMGDAAIHAVNRIAMRLERKRAIPAGPTYKIRGGKYELNRLRLFPSYLQAGPAFFIEKQKRKMIAEDITSALAFADGRASERARTP
jgi:uracil-DNA glycosylase